MNIRLLVLSLSLLMLACGSPAWSDYRPWSEKVFEHVAREYGEDAEKRLRFLHQLVLDNQDIPDMEKVTLVNKTLNHLPWIADSSHWKTADYWASPMETIATFGGDCEDIAIVKWVTLTHLGISKDHLRLTYVKIRETGENHMVLLYVKNPSDPIEKQEIYVLDNYVEEVKLGKERPDLLAIYVTDADGNIALINDKGGNRSIKGVYEDRKIKKLEDLKAKIAKNREIFIELNGGAPFLP